MSGRVWLLLFFVCFVLFCFVVFCLFVLVLIFILFVVLFLFYSYIVVVRFCGCLFEGRRMFPPPYDYFQLSSFFSS